MKLLSPAALLGMAASGGTKFGYLFPSSIALEAVTQAFHWLYKQSAEPFESIKIISGLPW